MGAELAEKSHDPWEAQRQAVQRYWERTEESPALRALMRKYPDHTRLALHGGGSEFDLERVCSDHGVAFWHFLHVVSGRAMAGPKYAQIIAGKLDVALSDLFPTDLYPWIYTPRPKEDRSTPQKRALAALPSFQGSISSPVRNRMKEVSLERTRIQHGDDEKREVLAILDDMRDGAPLAFAPLRDRVADPARSPDDGFEREVLRSACRERINIVLQTLTHREREILKRRCGLSDGNTYTLEEVGRIFKITRERARQVEAKAVRKLQQPVRANQLKEFLGE